MIVCLLHVFNLYFIHYYIKNINAKSPAVPTENADWRSRPWLPDIPHNPGRKQEIFCVLQIVTHFYGVTLLWLLLQRVQMCCRQNWKGKLPTRDRRAGRQGVYSPLSSWINIWSAELWWVLISALYPVFIDLLTVITAYVNTHQCENTHTYVTSECQIRLKG